MIVLPDLEGAAATSAEPERSAVHSWVDFESAHFIERWEGLCRGACRVKRAAEVTAVRRTSTAQSLRVFREESEQGWCGQDDRQQFNLVLWGTAATNSLIAEAS